MSIKPAICPDCKENPPVHHDGSGWFCEPCRAYAATISAVIEQNIRARRLKDPGERAERRRASGRAWFQRHKLKVKDYRKVYNRLYKRGLRGVELRTARLAMAA